MILAFDVYYGGDTAKVVCAVLQNWQDAAATHHWIKYLPVPADYIPGEFYKRELPCILSVLNDIDLTTITCIVIDGFVVLDDEGKKGLGAHLYEALQPKVPVIGVAKTNYHSNTANVLPIYRGESKNPLFITAIGMEVQEAANHIQHMAGEYRMPVVLKELDSKTKEK